MTVISSTVHERGVVATRIFDAPRDLVWRAFTDPDHLKQWWGPNGFTNTFYVFDLKPGGAWRFTMHGPDGKNYENESVFVAIDWLSRIVFDHVSPPHFRVTMSFEDLGQKTKFTFRQEFETKEIFERIKAHQHARPRAKSRSPRRASAADRPEPARTHDHPQLQGAARARLAGLDRSETSGPMVGARGLHQSGLRSRSPRRRRAQNCDARPGRDGLSDARRLQGDRAAGKTRLHQFPGRCAGSADDGRAGRR